MLIFISRGSSQSNLKFGIHIIQSPKLLQYIMDIEQNHCHFFLEPGTVHTKTVESYKIHA